MQTYPDVEYIIIDGASTDKTRIISEEYYPKFSEKGYLFKVKSEPDKGMYDALNKGAQMAHGELIGQINGDDWYECDAIQHMVDLFYSKNYDVAWGSIRICGKKTFIKYAKIGRLWTTSHWCHPAMFSTRAIILSHPYAVRNMYDDFDFITSVYLEKKKVVTTKKVISNFTFGEGGMSTKKSFADVKKRVDYCYQIYRKNKMSKLYYIQRWIVELSKYFFS